MEDPSFDRFSDSGRMTYSATAKGCRARDAAKRNVMRRSFGRTGCLGSGKARSDQMAGPGWVQSRVSVQGSISFRAFRNCPAKRMAVKVTASTSATGSAR